MKKKSILIACFFVLLVPFLISGQAKAAGWSVCDVVRVGSNAMHGFAYLELTSAGPDAGIFSNTIFQIEDSIRKEAMATALTALSLGEYIRVYISDDYNANGYQIVKAVYTYVP